MFGSVDDWLYQTLAGIRQTEASVGYKQIVIQPPPSNVLLFSGTHRATSTHGQCATADLLADQPIRQVSVE
jgi:hypothetical protein